MKALTVLGKRLAFGAVTAWSVLTLVFLAFTVTRDWVADRIEARIRWAMTGPDPADEADIQREIEQALSDYVAARNLDRPVYEQYVDWMGNMLTLDWGNSFESGEPVFPLVADATIRTASYVVPGIILAVTIGSLIGLYAALNPGSRLANAGRVGSYFLFAVPSFWLGGLLVGAAKGGLIEPDPIWFERVVPTILVTMTLLGGYVSYARAHALELASEDFVTLLRAKGADSHLVVRHVVRNAAIPLFSMLFTEALGLLVLGIFVIEIVFGIEGFGVTFFFAFESRDVPVLLGSTIVIILVGILGNVVQDLSYHYLDPRVGVDE